MNSIQIVASFLILAGAVVMAINVFKFRALFSMLNQFSIEEYGKTKLLFNFHYILMIFFLLGFVVVLYAVITEIALIGDLLVGIIFLFGAVFALLGIQLQWRMIVLIGANYSQALTIKAKLEREQGKLMETNEQLKLEMDERKRTEEMLKESEERYRGLVENSTDFIYTLDLKGNFTNVNKAAEHLTGYTKAELTKMNFRDYTSRDAHEEIFRGFHRIFQDGEPLKDFPFKVIVKDGTEKYFETSAGPIKKDNEIIGFQGSSRDITERKRAGDALRASENKYRTLLENLPQRIFYKGPDSVYISCNENFARDLKIKPEEVIGKTDYELFPRELAEKYKDDDMRVISSGKTEDIEEKYIQDGQERWVQTLKTPIKDEEGNATGVLGIFWDITDRKKAEEKIKEYAENLEKMVEERTKELHVAKEEAEAANRAKSDFLASMSHELRTPLNAVIGFSQILQDQYFGELNEKQADYVNDILESGKHLLSLINDILDLSKIEAGKVELELSTVNMKELFESSLIMIREKCMKRGINLILNITQDLEGLEIKADKRRLKQVMFNLLSNAAKFTPDGGVITVGADKETEELIISVKDTGIGIAPVDQGRIFEEFYQIKSSLADKTPGTGLGLSLVKRLVEMHDGRVWMESEGVGKGSRFSFSLPVR